MIAVPIVLIATAFAIAVFAGALLRRSSLIVGGVIGIALAIGALAIWGR